MVAGTTIITAPHTRLLKKLEREEVIGRCRLHRCQRDPNDQSPVSTMVVRLL